MIEFVKVETGYFSVVKNGVVVSCIMLDSKDYGRGNNTYVVGINGAWESGTLAQCKKMCKEKL